jgi:hypothetical protein
MSVGVEVQWSDLARDPKGIAAQVDEGDVRVRRRDGVDLILTRADRQESSAQGALIAARMLRRAVNNVPPEVVMQLALATVGEFPWVEVLPEADQVLFVKDLANAFQAALELDQWGVMEQAVIEWRSTAAVYADPEVLKALARPIDADEDFGPVPNPLEVDEVPSDAS